MRLIVVIVKRVQFVFLLSLLIFISAFECAFSQGITYSDVKKLSPNINSEFEDTSPTLSPDGETLYFVRSIHPENVGGKYAGSDIWFATRDKYWDWQPASNDLKQWNNKESNAVLGINKDNQVVYLLNSYSRKSGVAFSKKKENGMWGSPELIQIKNITGTSYVGYYVNSSYDVLLISMYKKDSYGMEDLYVCVKDSLEQWSPPINLGPTINTAGFEISPFLSDDGKSLYFSSDGHGGLGGADIFVSRRLYNSWTVWEKPKNLGPMINSDKFDSHYVAYGDSICYFASNRNSSFSDIYQAKIVTQNKNLLKDSVSSIINETQRLLSSLKTSANPVKKEKKVIYFAESSSVIPDDSLYHFKEFLIKNNLKTIDSVEILGYRMNGSTTNNSYNLWVARVDYLSEILVRLGVDPIKITSRQIVANSLQDNEGILELHFRFH